MTTVYIGVGSNIEREKHAQAAWLELSQLGFDLRSSPVYECQPVGFDGPAFFNFIISLQTTLDLTDLLQKLRQIEIKWGRQKQAQKYQNRTLDLDLVLFGNCVSVSAPELPRRDIFKYAFVIQPLYDLSPELVIPGDGRTVAEIWKQTSGRNLLHTIDFSFNELS